MVKNPSVNAGNIKRCEFSLWVGKIPWRRAWQPTSVFLPGESPWTEESGWLQSIGSQRVVHGWSNLARTGLNFLRKDWAEVGLERKVRERVPSEKGKSIARRKVNIQEAEEYRVVTRGSVDVSTPRRPISSSPWDWRNPDQGPKQIQSGPGISSKCSLAVSGETQDKMITQHGIR